MAESARAPRPGTGGRREWRLLLASCAVSAVLFLGLDLWLGHLREGRLAPGQRIGAAQIHAPDELLGWAPKPGALGRHVLPGDFDVVYSIDAEGYRQLPRHGDPARRVFLFGDSYTFGHGVADADTFASLLAREYLAPHVHVYNAGTNGYGVVQMHARFRGLEPELGPGDVVLFLPTSQDIRRNLKDLQTLAARFYHKPQLGRVTHFPVYRDGELSSVPLDDPWLELQSWFFVGRVTGRAFRALHAAWVGDATRREALAMLADTRRRAEARGARFLLVFLPETHESRCRCSLEDVSGFDFHDVSAFFPAGDAVDGIRFRGDSHWNPAGHALAARAVAETLRAAQVLEPGDFRQRRIHGPPHEPGVGGGLP